MSTSARSVSAAADPPVRGRVPFEPATVVEGVAAAETPVVDGDIEVVVTPLSTTVTVVVEVPGTAVVVVVATGAVVDVSSGTVVVSGCVVVVVAGAFVVVVVATGAVVVVVAGGAVVVVVETGGAVVIVTTGAVVVVVATGAVVVVVAAGAVVVVVTAGAVVVVVVAGMVVVLVLVVLVLVVVVVGPDAGAVNSVSSIDVFVAVKYSKMTAASTLCGEPMQDAGKVAEYVFVPALKPVAASHKKSPAAVFANTPAMTWPDPSLM
jgi:hypothetical protein